MLNALNMVLQCRERWANHLDPSLKKTAWSIDEDILLDQLQAKYGNRWSYIAPYLPGRRCGAALYLCLSHRVFTLLLLFWQ